MQNLKPYPRTLITTIAFQQELLVVPLGPNVWEASTVKLMLGDCSLESTEAYGHSFSLHLIIWSCHLLLCSCYLYIFIKPLYLLSLMQERGQKLLYPQLLRALWLRTWVCQQVSRGCILPPPSFASCHKVAQLPPAPVELAPISGYWFLFSKDSLFSSSA